MAEIYLVGGLTPRTDLDNYQTAFLSKEKAEESKAYWNSFHEDNDYDEYHIDSIEIDDMAEHDSELLDKVAESITEIYKCNLYCAEDYCDKEQCQNAEDCFYGAIVKTIERMKAEVSE